MNSIISKLKSLELSETEKTVKYSIIHNNGHTTLEQELILTRHPDRTWTAKLKFNDFPCQQTAQQAALKLADWMKRLSISINTGDFQIINIDTDLD